MSDFECHPSGTKARLKALEEALAAPPAAPSQQAAPEWPDEGELESWRATADRLLADGRSVPTALIREAAHLLQNAYRFTQSAKPSAPVPLKAKQIADIVRKHLTSVYVCTRVWAAWSVGTMCEDDFEPASETDMADDIAAALVGCGITGAKHHE